MAWINDGFSTTIYFQNAPSGQTLYFQEVSVTPPGIDMGGENDTTTMRNTAWRTRQPKQLKTLSEFTATCKYDPAVYSQILAMLGDNTIIVVTFPDDSTLRFWGWLDKFIPGESVEGEMSTATITVIPSNQDDSGNEVAPVYQAPGS
jgi:hypothetical protein